MDSVVGIVGTAEDGASDEDALNADEEGKPVLVAFEEAVIVEDGAHEDASDSAVEPDDKTIGRVESDEEDVSKLGSVE